MKNPEPCPELMVFSGRKESYSDSYTLTSHSPGRRDGSRNGRERRDNGAARFAYAEARLRSRDEARRAALDSDARVKRRDVDEVERSIGGGGNALEQPPMYAGSLPPGPERDAFLARARAAFERLRGVQPLTLGTGAMADAEHGEQPFESNDHGCYVLRGSEDEAAAARSAA